MKKIAQSGLKIIFNILKSYISTELILPGTIRKLLSSKYILF